MPSKFIVFQTPEGEKAVIFPSTDFYHDQMSSHFADYDVLSAGFVQIIESGQIHCFGRSESLGIDSRGEDDEIVISRQLVT
jgi:hypothetical protein